MAAAFEIDVVALKFVWFQHFLHFNNVLVTFNAFLLAFYWCPFKSANECLANTFRQFCL
jgi:hypothetical protein